MKDNGQCTHQKGGLMIYKNSSKSRIKQELLNNKGLDTDDARN